MSVKHTALLTMQKPFQPALRFSCKVACLRQYLTLKLCLLYVSETRAPLHAMCCKLRGMEPTTL